MAVVLGVHNGKNVWIIDDLIRAEARNSTTNPTHVLVDHTTGQLMENVGRAERDFMLKSVGTTYAAAQASYGTFADAVIRGQYLISSGKMAIHQAGPNYNISPNSN